MGLGHGRCYIFANTDWQPYLRRCHINFPTLCTISPHEGRAEGVMLRVKHVAVASRSCPWGVLAASWSLGQVVARQHRAEVVYQVATNELCRQKIYICELSRSNLIAWGLLSGQFLFLVFGYKWGVVKPMCLFISCSLVWLASSYRWLYP